MEEYRVDVKVRNNVILKQIEQAGYKTVCEFCRLNNVMKYTGAISEVVAMKRSPLQANGEFTSPIRFVAEIVGCDPIDLFTDTQLHTILKTNKRSIQVNEAEMKFMLESNGSQQKMLEDVVYEKQRDNKIDAALSILPDRYRTILEMRMGLGEYGREHTLDECAATIGVTRERVRQIETKALRMLRHPDRSSELREFAYNEWINHG